MKSFNPFAPFRRPPILVKKGTPETANMVLTVLKKHAPLGLSTKQIFEEAISIWPPGPDVPASNSSPMPHRSRLGTIIRPMDQPLNHPLRSIRFLKSVVLKELEDQQRVKMTIVPINEDEMRDVDRKRMTNKNGQLLPELKGWRWTLVTDSKKWCDIDEAAEGHQK